MDIFIIDSLFVFFWTFFFGVSAAISFIFGHFFKKCQMNIVKFFTISSFLDLLFWRFRGYFFHFCSFFLKSVRSMSHILHFFDVTFLTPNAHSLTQPAGWPGAHLALFQEKPPGLALFFRLRRKKKPVPRKHINGFSQNLAGGHKPAHENEQTPKIIPKKIL